MTDVLDHPLDDPDVGSEEPRTPSVSHLHQLADVAIAGAASRNR